MMRPQIFMCDGGSKRMPPTVTVAIPLIRSAIIETKTDQKKPERNERRKDGQTEPVHYQHVEMEAHYQHVEMEVHYHHVENGSAS